MKKRDPRNSFYTAHTREEKKKWQTFPFTCFAEPFFSSSPLFNLYISSTFWPLFLIGFFPVHFREFRCGKTDMKQVHTTCVRIFFLLQIVSAFLFTLWANGPCYMMQFAQWIVKWYTSRVYRNFHHITHTLRTIQNRSNAHILFVPISFSRLFWPAFLSFFFLVFGGVSEEVEWTHQIMLFNILFYFRTQKARI